MHIVGTWRAASLQCAAMSGGRDGALRGRDGRLFLLCIQEIAVSKSKMKPQNVLATPLFFERTEHGDSHLFSLPHFILDFKNILTH